MVVVDQLAKWWAVNALADRPIDLIDHTVGLRLLFNTGASFSIMPSAGPLLAIVALGIVAMIVYALGDASKRLEAIALGLVLGGAVGNLADRVFRGEGLLDGAVVDFIDVSLFTFNVADAAINVGVALLLLAVFIHRK